jgi:hydroxyethylthiazole kinase
MSAPSPAEALAAVQKSAPLVHVITNTLSQNDCANLLLAAGARPIMAEAEEEAAEIARNCGALVLNTGIPSAAKFRAMLAAGQAAGRAGIPILLDPVGIGVSAFRREQIGRLLETLRFAVIRGNSAEISVLAGDNPAFSGVDSGIAEDTRLAQLAARRFGAVILQSGGIDFLTDGRHTLRIPGGHPAMTKITGAGCMLSALTGAFLAANPAHPLESAAAAAVFWKKCAELAAARMEAQSAGTGSLHMYLLDAASRMAPDQLEEF